VKKLNEIYIYSRQAMNYFLEKIHKEGKIAISQRDCLSVASD